MTLADRIERILAEGLHGVGDARDHAGRLAAYIAERLEPCAPCGGTGRLKRIRGRRLVEYRCDRCGGSGVPR